jgi:hypothetical protein
LTQPARKMPSSAESGNWKPKHAKAAPKGLAVSRNLSDEEIRPVLKLKRHEIANFTEVHGVNLEWLLEGEGRIFEKDPIRLSPNSTGAEFAAVVATMPMADQQAIRTMVREIVQERDQ